MTEEYHNLSIPGAMWNEIKRIMVKHPELGFSSVAEFFKSAAREKMDLILARDRAAYEIKQHPNR